MKRENHLLPQIMERQNLYEAFWKAQRGHRHKADVEHYRQHLDAELDHLQAQLSSGVLDVGHYHYFYIYDPKERLICACSFLEKVMHHALMNVCHASFERYHIPDSYACRKGKGSHAAVRRAFAFCRQYAWFAKLDVRKYFETVSHQVLKDLLRRRFKEQRLLRYFDQIIDSYESLPNRGLPIGNLTSQYFANHILAVADHFAKEQLKAKAYVRYMDDMVFWGNDREALLAQVRAFAQFVASHLACELKPLVFNRTALGLPFLGYRLTRHRKLLHSKSKRRFLRKSKQVEGALAKGLISEEQAQVRMQALVAVTEHADACAFRKSVLLHRSGSMARTA